MTPAALASRMRTLPLIAAGLSLFTAAAMAEEPVADTTERTRLTDFDDADANARWRMVNDNVMGGRSDGDVRFGDSAMTFFGDINTNGGGFSSVRLPIDPGTLAGAEQIVMRLKPDGRGPYRLLVIDDRGGRDTLHRRDLAFDAPAGEWQTVTVDLEAMIPTFHGRPIDAAPLDPGRAVAIGFILNDTGDGPFALQVDWIDVAR